MLVSWYLTVLLCFVHVACASKGSRKSAVKRSMHECRGKCTTLFLEPGSLGKGMQGVHKVYTAISMHGVGLDQQA